MGAWYTRRDGIGCLGTVFCVSIGSHVAIDWGVMIFLWMWASGMFVCEGEGLLAAGMQMRV